MINRFIFLSCPPPVIVVGEGLISMYKWTSYIILVGFLHSLCHIKRTLEWWGVILIRPGENTNDVCVCV